MKNDSGLLDFLLTKSNFIQELNPLIKTNNIEDYEKILNENVNLL